MRKVLYILGQLTDREVLMACGKRHKAHRTEGGADNHPGAVGGINFFPPFR